MSEKALSEVVLKAWTDPEFKARLEQDPKTMLQAEGFSFARGDVDVRLVENTDEVTYFILPQPPSELGSIDEDELKNIAADVLSVQLVLPTILT